MFIDGMCAYQMNKYFVSLYVISSENSMMQMNSHSSGRKTQVIFKNLTIILTSEGGAFSGVIFLDPLIWCEMVQTLAAAPAM